MSTFVKKSLSILLVITMLFSLLAINSSAETVEDEYGVMPCWSIISTVATSFTISGINSTSSVLLTSQFTVNLFIQIELQKLKSTGYETIETWSAFESNGTYLTLEETRLINIFEDYRIKVTCVAGNEQHITYDYP
ncbi:MAG: hypothetical protein J6B37_04625 [Clostridia bacterium]|nr:hypothetical protein [Clostridia bacterium]